MECSPRAGWLGLAVLARSLGTSHRGATFRPPPRAASPIRQDSVSHRCRNTRESSQRHVAFVPATPTGRALPSYANCTPWRCRPSNGCSARWISSRGSDAKFNFSARPARGRPTSVGLCPSGGPPRRSPHRRLSPTTPEAPGRPSGPPGLLSDVGATRLHQPQIARDQTSERVGAGRNPSSGPPPKETSSRHLRDPSVVPSDAGRRPNSARTGHRDLVTATDTPSATRPLTDAAVASLDGWWRRVRLAQSGH